MARDKASGGRPGGRKDPSPPQRRRASEPAAPPDLKVQLPYFAARIAVFAIALAVFIGLHFNPIYAALFGLVVAGVLTYPLGRMQKRAARRAAGSDPR